MPASFDLDETYLVLDYPSATEVAGGPEFWETVHERTDLGTGYLMMVGSMDKTWDCLMPSSCVARLDMYHRTVEFFHTGLCSETLSLFLCSRECLTHASAQIARFLRLDSTRKFSEGAGHTSFQVASGNV